MASMSKRANTVPVETVMPGDLVALTWKDDDVTRTAYGRIADIRYAGKTRILMSEKDHEIGRYDITSPGRVQCVMMERYTILPPSLFEMSET